MALRTIPMRRAGNRYSLFMGGDREMVMFTGLLAAILVFTTQDWLAFFAGVGLWLGALKLLRKMAKSDPQMRHVYLRNRRYKPYYPARATPFRSNETSQGNQYK